MPGKLLDHSAAIDEREYTKVAARLQQLDTALVVEMAATLVSWNRKCVSEFFPPQDGRTNTARALHAVVTELLVRFAPDEFSGFLNANYSEPDDA